MCISISPSTNIHPTSIRTSRNNTGVMMRGWNMARINRHIWFPVAPTHLPAKSRAAMSLLAVLVQAKSGSHRRMLRCTTSFYSNYAEHAYTIVGNMADVR